MCLAQGPQCSEAGEAGTGGASVSSQALPVPWMLADCTIYFYNKIGLSIILHVHGREHSGSVVECLTRDRGAAGSSLTGVTVLCPLAGHIYPCLVLVQPRKTRPNISEKLFTGT